jgi:hypothetical protein
VPTGPRPPIPPLHAKVDLGGTFFGHAWHNIFYLALAGTGIATSDCNTLAGTINTQWGTQFKPQVPSDVVLTNVRLVYVPSVGNEILGISTTGQTGSYATAAIQDAAISYILNWNVNKYYRGGHPRWYLPGVNTGTIGTGSSVGAGMRTSLGTAMTSFLNAINAATTTNITSVQMGTVSFQSAGAWRNPPQFWPFVSGSVNGIIGTQRRRIRG